MLNEPYYIRNFNGAFIYFLQNIVNDNHMVVLKYDIYDPNSKITGKDIGTELSNTRKGDVKFNTFGAGYIYFVNTHLKVVLWYDVIKNEATSLNGFTTDIKDNIFTCRVQFRF
jgi:phosphate-selective porin